MKKLVLILFVGVFLYSCKGKKAEMTLEEVPADSTVVQVDSLVFVDSSKVDSL